jgi:hypothetical protein
MAMRDGERLLRIYVNDHLAASAGALALARRVHRSNPDGELGRFLAGLVRDFADDHAALERVREALGLARNPAKQAAARTAVAAGRLKLNGRLRGYSDLSRLLELDGLLLCVEAKRGVWTTLGEVRPCLPVDVDALLRRTETHRASLELHRRDAARRAFGA